MSEPQSDAGETPADRSAPLPASAGPMSSGPASSNPASSEPGPPDPGQDRPRYDVFISYTQADTAVAVATQAALEAGGIRTFLAPSMIPGDLWLEKIGRAIADSRMLVLILSGPSSKSSWVLREVTLATEKSKPIIPFRIDDVPLSEAMELLVRTVHWLVALPPPAENYFPALCQTVSSRLATPDDRAIAPSSGRPVIRIAWPTARSYFATGETHTLRWEAFAGVGSTIRRFEIELYLDKEATCIDHIGGGIDGPLDGQARKFDWTISRELKDGFKYRVKMLAWDSHGQVGFAFSEPFSLSAAGNEVTEFGRATACFGALAGGIAIYRTAVSVQAIGPEITTHFYLIPAVIAADIGASLTWIAGTVFQVCPLLGQLILGSSIIAGGVLGWAGATFQWFKIDVFAATGIGAFWGMVLGAAICSQRYRNAADFAMVVEKNGKFWSRLWEGAIEFTARRFVRK
jgi:TIR domain